MLYGAVIEVDCSRALGGVYYAPTLCDVFVLDV